MLGGLNIQYMQQAYSVFNILLRCQASYTEVSKRNRTKLCNGVRLADAIRCYSRIEWHRIRNVIATIDIRSLVYRISPKNFKLVMVSRRAALGDNIIVNCHIFQLLFIYQAADIVVGRFRFYHVQDFIVFLSFFSFLSLLSFFFFSPATLGAELNHKQPHGRK